MDWLTDAMAAISRGERLTVRAWGGALGGRISDGQRITLAPVRPEDVQTGDLLLLQEEARARLCVVKEASPPRFLLHETDAREKWVVLRWGPLGRVIEVHPREVVTLEAEDVHWMRGFLEGTIPVPMWAEWWRSHSARFEQRLGRTESLRMKMKPREGVEQLLRLAGVPFTARAPEVGPPSPEEYTVLSVLLAHVLEREQSKRDPVCITATFLTEFQQELGRDPSVLRHWMSLDALGQTARDDLLRKSMGDWRLEPRLTLPGPYRLVTPEELHAVAEEHRQNHPSEEVRFAGSLGFRFSEAHLRHFGNRFLISVSRVGFGAGGREALACVKGVMGTPLGQARCVFLRLEEAGWRVVDSQWVRTV